jgi:hypothetical protein
MIGNFLLASDAEIASLLAKPETITPLLYPPGGGLPLDKAVDVDKAWHGIHFLLCGQPWDGNPPLNFIVSGGSPIGDVDVGYGPARAFTSHEVRAIAEALVPIDGASLGERFNAQEFTEQEIYPEIWGEPREECLGYLLDYFCGLKEFVLHARDVGLGLIVYIN